MADLIKRIVLAIKNIFHAGVVVDSVEALSVGSPAEREGIASSFKNFFELTQKPIKDKLTELEETHSPMTPEESEAWVIAMAGVGAGGLALGAAGSVIAEAATLGQVETISEWLKSAWVQVGLAGLISVPVVTMYDKALRIPYTHLINSRFTPNIPGISDQIRFAVREAYPGVPIEMMSSEMEKWIKYLGFSKYWADSFWNAHWIIPTLSQARELWQRGVIDQTDYIDFLRLSDYDPKYNPLWLQLAWSLPGRIDQRWLYEWGAISREDLIKFVRAEGIHPDWQEAIADTYIKNILRDEISRVRTQLITMFREGFIDEAKLRSELSDIGFIPDVIDMSVKEAILRRDYDTKSDLLKYYMTQLQKFEIDEEEFIRKCRELGMTEEAITIKLDITLLKQKKTTSKEA